MMCLPGYRTISRQGIIDGRLAARAGWVRGARRPGQARPARRMPARGPAEAPRSRAALVAAACGCGATLDLGVAGPYAARRAHAPTGRPAAV